MNLYQKICNDLREAIAEEQLKPGDRILSISEMKEKYAVSHITALRVYRELSEAGLIVRRHGQGYFVRDNTPQPRKVFGRFAVFVRTIRPQNANDNYFNEINMGIQMEAANRRMDLLLPHHAALLNTSLPSEEALAEIRRAMFACAESVDGFLLDERIPDSVIDELIGKTRKPAVVLNRKTDLPVNMVYPDNESALRTILDMGARMKYTQFVFCAKASAGSYSSGDYNSKERAAVFRRLSRTGNYEVLENCLTVPREVYLERITDACRRHQAKGRVLLICTTDHLAADLVSHFTANGKAPGNPGIAGLDGLAIAAGREPKLTTMKIDTFAIGRKAVEVLQESLNGTDSYAPETVLVSPVFQLGETMN